MADSHCPSPELLDAIANGMDPSAAVSNHVSGCSNCQNQISALRDDAVAAKELRAAAESEVDGPQRRRLLIACRQAMANISEN